jgi:hypothetical protein
MNEQKLGGVSESVDRSLATASTMLADEVTIQLAGFMSALHNAVSNVGVKSFE